MHMRHAAVVTGLALGLMSGTAQADVISTFTASGLFDNGAVLGGTVKIDITSGAITSVALTTSTPFKETYPRLFSVQGPSDGGYLFFADGPVAGQGTYISALLDANSLVNYDGGLFGSLSHLSPIGDTSELVVENNGVAALSFGSLSAVSAVPLPTSAPMFGAALLALGAVGYGVKRKGKAAV